MAEGEVVPAALRPLVRGTVADLKDYCRRTPLDELYFALPFGHYALIEDLASFAADNFLSFRIVPDYAGTVGRNVDVRFHDRIPILAVRHEPLGIYANQLLKRGFDIVFFVAGNWLGVFRWWCCRWPFLSSSTRQDQCFSSKCGRAGATSCFRATSCAPCAATTARPSCKLPAPTRA